MGREYLLKSSPSYDNNEVKSIPGLCHVSVFAPKAHGTYLDHHFDREKHVNHVVQIAEYVAARRRARIVVARLIHSQSDAVDDDS